MTEALPRGPVGPQPTTIPAISWFEFLLNDRLLEEHLSQDNPDPTPAQLLIQFLQQAETLQTSLQAQQPLPQIGHTQGGGVKAENAVEPKPAVPGENKKLRALKLLALRVMAFMDWNMTDMLKSVPLVMLQYGLNELNKLTLGCDLDHIDPEAFNLEETSAPALFAMQLYFRWCILSVVKESFPTRPVRSFLQIQGVVDPGILLSAATQNLVKNLRAKAELCVSALEKCIGCGRPLAMPTLPCFLVPKNEEVQEEAEWDQCLTVSPNEYNCQINYDLGTYHFYQEAYPTAYSLFQQCSELFYQLKSPVYCKVEETRLKAYLTACKNLRGENEKTEIKPDSLYEQAEFCRKNKYKGLVEVFIDDNNRQELSPMYRSDVEEELSNKGEEHSTTYVQVSICNVIRGVMEGKALVSLLSDILDEADTETVDFLLMVIAKALEVASFSQKSNLKCFVWHLMDLSQPRSRFNTMVMEEPIRNHFSGQELQEMRELADEEASQVYGEMMDDDMTMTCTSFPSSRGVSFLTEGSDSSVSLGNAEHQLLYMYEPDIMRRLVVELVHTYRRSPAYIMSLNEKWKVPKEMHQQLMTLPPSADQAFAYLLIGKANHCMDVRIYERARQLLTVADSVVADMSYTLSKHVRWHMLLADLMQHFLNESLPDNTSLQDLVKRTKTCITCVRLGQDIQPCRAVLEHCAGFLQNIKDWTYLTNMENSGCGFIEVCRLLSCICKELPSTKNARKPARDLWEAVRVMFTTSNEHKRNPSARVTSAIHRDPNMPILPREAFVDFMRKIKEPTALSLLVSCLTKFYNIIRDDISNEIASDYIPLWPTTLTNTAAINASAIEEAVSILILHCLKIQPTQASFLRTQADIYFANNQYSPALKHYMEAGVVASDFFSSAVPKSVYDDQVYRRMIKCCSYLQCHTQVAVLCQFLEETDYSTAFKALQERNVYDAMDTYYSCVWDISILEYLVHLHARRGEVDKRSAAMKALSQLDLNSSNPDDIVQRAVQIRKRKFLRALAKQYL